MRVEGQGGSGDAMKVKLIDFGLAHAGDHSKIDRKNIVAGENLLGVPQV